jgi:hypothetical protein
VIDSPESLLRRALFEDTGGMYPELITRPDIKVFLPPIGGLTVYICALVCLWVSSGQLNHFVVGNPAFLTDQSKELTLRVHDECEYEQPRRKIVVNVRVGNGSDVFGSDICTWCVIIISI